LYLAQAALTIWMLVDANRRGVESVWFWIILWFQPLGAWAYFFSYKLSDFRLGVGTGWMSNLFTRRASLEELRYRVEQSPTVAAPGRGPPGVGRAPRGEETVRRGRAAPAVGAGPRAGPRHGDVRTGGVSPPPRPARRGGAVTGEADRAAAQLARRPGLARADR